MSQKKNKSANIEKKKPTLLLIGLVVSLALVLESFEWLSTDYADQGLTSSHVESEMQDVIEDMKEEIIKPKQQKQQEIKPKTFIPDSVIIAVDTVVKSAVMNWDTSLVVIVDPLPCPDCPPCIDCDDDDTIPEIDNTIFDVVEDMPEFPGGAGAMYSYLGGKIKYPSISADNGSQGKAYVNFTVEPDGSLSNVIVVKSSADKFCQKEAIRVVKGMPKWKPGKQRGKKVRVSFTIPIKFKLQP